MIVFQNKARAGASFLFLFLLISFFSCNTMDGDAKSNTDTTMHGITDTTAIADTTAGKYIAGAVDWDDFYALYMVKDTFLSLTSGSGHAKMGLEFRFTQDQTPKLTLGAYPGAGGGRYRTTRPPFQLIPTNETCDAIDFRTVRYSTQKIRTPIIQRIRQRLEGTNPPGYVVFVPRDSLNHLFYRIYLLNSINNVCDQMKRTTVNTAFETDPSPPASSNDTDDPWYQ